MRHRQERKYSITIIYFQLIITAEVCVGAIPFKMYIHVPSQEVLLPPYICVALNSFLSFSWVMYMESVNRLKRLVLTPLFIVC